MSETKPIKKQFAERWQRILAFYEGNPAQQQSSRYPEMVKLIKYLIGKGYASKLRAGQQMDTFIVSRARYNGLALRQPNIRIHLNKSGGTCFKITYITPDDKEEFTVDDCSNYEPIVEKIEHLTKYPIDWGEFGYLYLSRRKSPNFPDSFLNYIRVEATADTDYPTRTEVPPENLRQALVELLYKYEMSRKDLQLVRHLLREETAWTVKHGTVNGTNVFRLASMISYFGSLDDLLFLWEMRHMTFDMIASIDAGFFFGHGYDETVTYLKELQKQEASDIINFLEQHTENGKPDEYVTKIQQRINGHFSK